MSSQGSERCATISFFPPLFLLTLSLNACQKKTMTAELQTSKGTMTIELYEADAPKTVANFKGLAEEGYKRGVVAMANRGPNTNLSQFFIVLRDLPSLPKNFTMIPGVDDPMNRPLDDPIPL